jgi:hypothetical protein
MEYYFLKRCRKTFNKIQHSFKITTCSKITIEFLNLQKEIMRSLQLMIKKKINASPLKSVTKKDV